MRVKNYSMVDANDDLPVITQDLNKDDLILIILTNQLESQKKKIENLVKPLQARVVEIIANNVVYDNEFITFPSDLRPICERDDKEAVWSRIEQSLKDILPPGKTQNPERDQTLEHKRLEAVKNDPKFPELLKVKPSSSRIYGRLGCGVLFGIIFAGGPLFINYILIDPVGGQPWYFRLILSLFTLLGVGMIIYGIYRLIKLSTTKLRRLPALIVDKRTSVSGGGQSSSARTTYYVTVELDDGERQELESAGKLYGKITKDDVGAAYIRERFLLDFRRLAV